MNKKLIISFVLSSALCAPYAQAMSSLLPRARQIAAMVMKPGVRSAVTQANRTVTNTARNTSRTVAETVQPVRQPMTQKLSSSFATQAPKAAQNSQQSGSRLATGVGLAAAIGGAVTYAQADTKANTPLPKDFLTTTDEDTLIKMMRANPDCARQFAGIITGDNVLSIDDKVRDTIIEMYPEAATIFERYIAQIAEPIINNFQSMLAEADCSMLHWIWKVAEKNAHVKEKILKASQLIEPGTSQELIAQAKADRYPTPTEAYLCLGGAIDTLKEYYYDLVPSVRRVVKSVIALEKKYQDTHYTFTHGRNRGYDYVSAVYGRLWEYAHNTKLPADFSFTYTKNVTDPLTGSVLMDAEIKLHEANINEPSNVAKIRQRRLFLNSQLFGNSFRLLGSSSLDYFFSGTNSSGRMLLKVEDIFRQFGQHALYEKYQDEFKALEKEHAALSPQGEILVVAVPKDRLNQDVMCIGLYDEAPPKYMINGKMTNNAQDILEARKKDPLLGDNQLNFTLALSDSAALDPQSGIKIHSVQGVDPVKYAVWQKKFDALMAKVEDEFKSNWNRSLKAKQKGHNELLEAVRASRQYAAVQDQHQ